MHLGARLLRRSIPEKGREHEHQLAKRTVDLSLQNHHNRQRQPEPDHKQCQPTPTLLLPCQGEQGGEDPKSAKNERGERQLDQ